MNNLLEKFSLKKVGTLFLCTVLITSYIPVELIYAEVKDSIIKEKNEYLEQDVVNDEFLQEQDVINEESEQGLSVNSISIQNKDDIYRGDRNIKVSLKADSTKVKEVKINYTTSMGSNHTMVLNYSSIGGKFETNLYTSDSREYICENIVLIGFDGSETILEDSSLCEQLNYIVNEHTIEDITTSEVENLEQGDLVDVSFKVAGNHKVKEVTLVYDNGETVKLALDSNDDLFKGNIQLNKPGKYKLQQINIQKSNTRVWFTRENNEELLSKLDFNVKRFAGIIESINVIDKDNLYLFQDVTVEAQVNDIDTIKKIELTYEDSYYNSKKVLNLLPNEDGNLSDKFKLDSKYLNLKSMRVYKSNDRYIDYTNEDIENIKSELYISAKVPVLSANIKNRDNIEQYSTIEISGNIINSSYIDSVYIEYNNMKDTYLKVSTDGTFIGKLYNVNNGENYVRFLGVRDKNGRLYNYTREEIESDNIELLEQLDFSASEYQMPITSIEVDSKDVSVLENVNITATVNNPDDINFIELSGSNIGTITLNKQDEVFRGSIVARYSDNKIDFIRIHKNDGSIKILEGEDILEFEDSLAFNINIFPIESIVIDGKDDLDIESKINIKANLVEEHINRIIINYNNGYNLQLYKDNSFESIFYPRYQGEYKLSSIELINSNGEHINIDRNNLSEDIIFELDFEVKEYEMPIKSFEIIDLENLYAFDKTIAKVEVKNPDIIDRVEIQYHGDKENLIFNKTEDNTFEGEYTILPSSNIGDIDKVNIYKSDGKVISIYKYDLNEDILDIFSYTAKLPIEFVNIDSTENIVQGDIVKANIGIINKYSSLIDEIYFNYNNGQSFSFRKSGGFKSYLQVNNCEKYELRNIAIKSNGNQWTIGTDKHKDILEKFTFEVKPYDLKIESIDVYNNELANIGQGKISVKVSEPELINSMKIVYQSSTDIWRKSYVQLEFNEDNQLFEGLISGEIYNSNKIYNISSIEAILNNDINSKISINRETIENYYNIDLTNTDIKIIGYRPYVSKIEVSNSIYYGQQGTFRLEVENPHETLKDIKLVYYDNSKEKNAISIDLKQTDNIAIYEGSIDYNRYIKPENYKLGIVIAGNYINIDRAELVATGVSINDTNLNILKFDPQIEEIIAQKNEAQVGESITVNAIISNLENGAESIVNPKLIYKSAGYIRRFDLKFNENGQLTADVLFERHNDVRQWKLEGISYYDGLDNKDSFISIEDLKNQNVNIENDLIYIGKSDSIDTTAPNVISRVDLTSTYIEGESQPNSYVVVRNKNLSVSQTIIAQGYADKDGKFKLNINRKENDGKLNIGDVIEVFAYVEDGKSGAYITKSNIFKVKRSEGEIIAEDLTIKLKQPYDILQDVVAINRDDEVIDKSKIKVIGSDSVNNSKKGTYKVEYRIVDTDGSSISKTRKVVVTDESNVVAPSIEDKINQQSEYIEGKTYPNMNVVAKVLDTENNNVEIKIAEGNSDNTGNFKLKINEEVPYLVNNQSIKIYAYKKQNDGSILTTDTNIIKVGKSIHKILADDIKVPINTKLDKLEELLLKNVQIIEIEGNLETSNIDILKIGEIKTNVVGKYEVIYRYTNTDKTVATKSILVELFKPISVKSVTIEKELTLSINETKTLIAKINPSNATNQNIIWSSDKPEIVSVNEETGEITGLKEGKAIIKVTTEDGGKTAACKVSVVIPTESIEIITEEVKEMKVGETKQLEVIITPKEATNKAVIWSTSNKKVATVDSKGNVKAIGSGDVIITAKTKDTGITDEWSTKVIKPVTSIKLNKTSAKLNISKSTEQELQLKATINPKDATYKDVTWNSSDENVAVVDKNGKVSIKDVGLTDITVKSNDGNKTATCKLEVVRPVESVSIVDEDEQEIKEVDELKLGEERSVFIKINPENAGNQEVVIKSSNTKVADYSYDKENKMITVEAKNKGKANISVTTRDGNKKAVYKVEVVKPVKEVKLDKDIVYINEGKYTNLKATINPTDASDKSVSWKVAEGDETIIKVDQKGKVTAIGSAGQEATIIVTANGISDDGYVKEDRCTVKIVKPVKAVEIIGDRVEIDQKGNKILNLSLYESIKLNAKITDLLGDTELVNPNVSWSTSKKSVVDIDKESGELIANKVGKATITVKTEDGGKTAKCTVIVN